MNTLTPTYEELAPFILDGDGYKLTITSEAEARKLGLLLKSGTVTTVTSNDQSADAQHVTRSLAAMRIEVEKCRKIVVEPVNAIVKKINGTAADFVAEITAEESRIRKLVGDHATEQARLKALKEAEERKAFEDARRAREEALAAKEAAEMAKSGKQGIALVIATQEAAKAAESERIAALAARMATSAEVAGTKVAEGVRFTLDFEVLDIDRTLFEQPNLVDLTIRRADTLSYLKAQEAAGIDPIKLGAIMGLKVFKKPVVSSR